MASKKKLLNNVLIELGLKEGPQPASGASVALLYLTLGIDVVFIFARIATLVLMWRDWCRAESKLRQTFFAFAAVYLLLDVPRLGLYSSPLLFSYGATKEIGNLLIAAGYYKVYWTLARSICLMTLSWNRLAVIAIGQRPQWNTERSGPTVFLLILMPLLPTAVISILPQTFGDRLETALCVICWGLSGLCLGIAFFVSFKDILYPPHTDSSRLEEMLLLAFPLWILMATVISAVVESAVVKSADKKWTETDTDVAVVTGIDVLYTLFIDTVSFVLLFVVSSRFRSSIFRSPLPAK